MNEFYQVVFDFFNDWNIMDIDLINKRMDYAMKTATPWGLGEINYDYFDNGLEYHKLSILKERAKKYPNQYR